MLRVLVLKIELIESILFILDLMALGRKKVDILGLLRRVYDLVIILIIEKVELLLFFWARLKNLSIFPFLLVHLHVQ